MTRLTAYDPDYAEKLGGGTTLGSPTSGDLSGPLPSPSVVGIQGIPVCDDVPSVGQALVYDGTSWCPATVDAGGSGMVPYYIASGDTFTVPINKQAPFAMVIDVVGTLIVDGFLIEVT